MNDSRLEKHPFQASDLVRGDDGEYYHLPTLRALYRLGRLSPDSAGYALLMRVMLAATPAFARLTA